MDKQFKQFIGEIKGIDEKEKTITAYISTSKKDRMGESLKAKGADLKPFRKNPVVLFGHKYDEPPVAKALWTKSDDKGLLSKMQFAETQFAQEIFELYKGGFMNAFSVGFLPKKWEDGDGIKQPFRTYTEWELLEYSAVPVPANPEALTMAMSKGLLTDEALIKSFNAPIEKLHEIIKDENISEEEEKKEYSEGVLEGIISENEQLKEENKVLKAENNNLMTQIYKLYTAPDTKGTLAEMTDTEIAQKVSDITIGVINHAKGKVS